MVQFTNAPAKGKTEKHYITLKGQWETWCNGRPFAATNEGAPKEGGNWTLRPVSGSLLDAGGFGQMKPPFSSPLSFKHGYNFPSHALWGAKAELRITGPNEIRGSWTYGDEQGDVAWSRAMPSVSDVEFQSGETKERIASGGKAGRVMTKYSGPDNEMRGNRPRFTIRVFGDNLWGHHVCWIDGTDLELITTSPIYVPKDSGKPHDVAGISMNVNVWPRATPGRKILHVDDIEIPFDLLVEGFPAVPELRFVRFAGGKYEPVAGLRHGDEFFVEARYSEKPQQAPGKVQLTWTDGQPREVEVLPVEDGKLFRSARLKLEPPAAR